MNEDKTPVKFIERKIEEAFNELAGYLADSAMTPDDTAGVPMALFKAERELVTAWQQIVKEKLT